MTSSNSPELESAKADSACADIDELAYRARQRDSAAFEELYALFWPRLNQFLRVRLRGTQVDPEDVTQEAFAKAWASIDRFDAQHRFSTWLYTIALRTATDARRRLTTAYQRRETVAIRDECLDGDLVGQADEVENIWSIAKSKLTTEQYTVLWLRFGEDMSIKEVAAAVNRTQVAIRVLLFRARKRVREFYDVSSQEPT
ncbi:MAG: sigma-70 family RNA polymerase sigma factor [Planctomycetota bacterium]